MSFKSFNIRNNGFCVVFPLQIEKYLAKPM